MAAHISTANEILNMFKFPPRDSSVALVLFACPAKSFATGLLLSRVCYRFVASVGRGALVV